jgi:dynein heavy chain, axonemal
LDNHFCTFDRTIAELSGKIVNATMTVFLAIALSPQFMPTAKKFHYQFNLRDFSKVIQNMNLAVPGHYKQ